MPENIYKDFLADQNFDELREMYFYSLITGCFCFIDHDEAEENEYYNDLNVIDDSGDGSEWSTYNNRFDGDNNGMGATGIGNYNTCDLIEDYPFLFGEISESWR